MSSKQDKPGPLRIAFIVDRFPVLSESFIINEVAGAMERGHDVTILSLAAAPSETVVHGDFNKWDMLSRTEYLGVPRSPGPWIKKLLAILWQYRRFLPALAARYDHQHFGATGDRAKFMHQALRLLSMKPFDVIHCQFGLLGLKGLQFRESGVLQGKLITMFRGHDVSRHVQEVGGEVYTELFRKGDYFLTNCDFFRDKLLQLGCDSERLTVKRSGVVTDRFSFRTRHAPTAGNTVVASVGRLVEKKGVSYCLQGFAKALQSWPALEYHILGDGPLRQELEALTDQLGIRHAVKFHGAGNHDDVVNLLHSAHLFLATSVTAANGDQDAAINTAKEAMAMGLPVISTWHGGIPELVEDGVSGRLVPERDAGAIAAALSELLAKPEDWAALGSAGRARVEADYDQRRLNDQLNDIYRAISEQP
ncbi:glycosyltransferase [Allohahella marinimesophila]|uniref:Colanic acid biosynthesis glycosyltransferase WcaL n=1 Tax=Allohahella marinimesophila TaxID=1054972 RepID=A0ABP7PX69_9GAMM